MKLHYLGIGLALTLAAGMGVADAQNAAAPRRGGTVVFALGGDPPTVNPAVTSGVPDGVVGCMIYQGLVQPTPDLRIKPLLAKSWSVSPDGLTYDFTLNQAKWQDGKPFTSEDVKFSLLEVSAKYSPTFAGAGKLIEAIDTPAPDRAVIRLKQPFGPFLLSLSCAWGGAIVPAHVFRNTNPLQNPATTATPIGTGAFKLTEWVRQDHIRLTRNPDYWEPGKPYLDEIVAKVIPQAGARTQALQAGEIDFINYFYFPISDLKTVEANPKLTVLTAAAPPSINYLFFNVKRGPFADKRVRQALAFATDREYVLRTAWLGAGLVGTMPFSSGFKWAADPTVDYRRMYPFDPAKANALLDAAGFKRGADGVRFQLHLTYAAEDTDYPLVGGALKGLWRDVGIDVVQDTAERSIVTKKVYQDHDFDLFLNSYGTFGDPALGTARAFVTSAIGRSFANASSYSNPTVDKLFEEGERATGEEERGKFYRQAQAILADELPVLTLREKALVNVTTKGLEGTETENDWTSWRDAWLAK